MAKIKYTSDGLFAQTECPFDKKWKVNSFSCHRCKNYRSTNYKEHYVVCLADCASQIEEIIANIDVVVANSQVDDIDIEEFLVQIREKLAKMLDGNNEEE